MRYLVPRAEEYGGIQRFARDSAAWLPSDCSASILDLGRSRGVQARRVLASGLRELEMKATARLHPGTARPLNHHWHILSAVPPLLSCDVLTCHGNELLDERLRRPYRFALQRARAITSNSAFTKQLVAERFDIDSAKITVIPPGVAPNACARPITTDPEGRLVIGTLCRFVERKNVARIIDALELLAHETGSSYVYYLAGDGPLRIKVLDHLASAGIAHKYWGPITDRAKYEDFLPALDLFVLPSLELASDVEGFGIVYLEANAAGVPVVAARTGGSADAVAEGVSGTFADPTSVESIAAAIRSLAPMRPALEEGCRAWADRFSNADTGLRLAQLYSDVASR